MIYLPLRRWETLVSYTLVLFLASQLISSSMTKGTEVFRSSQSIGLDMAGRVNKILSGVRPQGAQETPGVILKEN